MEGFKRTLLYHVRSSILLVVTYSNALAKICFPTDRKTRNPWKVQTLTKQIKAVHEKL